MGKGNIENMFDNKSQKNIQIHLVNFLLMEIHTYILIHIHTYEYAVSISTNFKAGKRQQSIGHYLNAYAGCYNQ